MSIKNWPGGRISSVPPTPSGPFENSTASGVWTLEQQAYWEAQNLWPTQGNVDPSAFIENLFSTWLYTGNGSTQTITNGIDLAGKGGLVWSKDRGATQGHVLYDTARGPYPTAAYLTSNSTEAASLSNAANFANITSFNSSGYTIGSTSSTNIINFSGSPYVSWTFREQPKFFDIVTWSGNNTDGRSISHNLGSVPGCIIVKCINAGSTDWFVWHRSIANNGLLLNNTSRAESYFWNPTDSPTSTNILVSNTYGTNTTGQTYVAYLFAHDAGGFGLTGTDNVISCGTYTGNGSATGPVVSLGYEPQWLMVKNATGTGNWQIIDSMRGMPVGLADVTQQANLTNAETSVEYVSPTATGFQITSTSSEVNTNGATYIYIAIRRGPMKVPTTGTSVFNSIARTGTGVVAQVTGVGFTPDLYVVRNTYGITELGACFIDRLRGNPYLNSSNTGASAASPEFTSLNMNGVTLAAQSNGMANYQYEDGVRYINYFFKRAPGFFDEVCYTGTGVARTVAHNLAAVPELMIVKGRSGATAWQVYSSALANTQYLVLNTTAAVATGATRWNSTTPTSSVFSLGTASEVNTSAATYVAYLFASAPGVSKVGSYTGTGATQVINCGFTAGARFVLIKRTDSTGDWYVWDSARGIVAGNDPYLLLNSTAAEVTNTDFIDTAATGFEISSTAPAAINASGGTFIFLAIA